MEILLIIIFVFICGSAVGSFLRVLVDRLPKNENVFLDRSECASCKKKLSPIELIPVVSYLLQNGKCRHCKVRIPFKLFVMEVLVGAIFSGLFAYFIVFNLPIPQLVYVLVVFSIFIAIFFTDLESGIIPDQLTLVLLIVVAVYSFIFMPHSIIVNHIITGILFCLFFFILHIATRGRGMGFGDVKLAFPLGLFLGYPLIIPAFYISFLTGAAISIILVLWGKKNFKKSTIPFGPFLIFAAAISYFFGQAIIDFALKTFF